MSPIRRCIPYALVVALMSAFTPAQAARDPSGLSELSAISLLPVAAVGYGASAALAGTAQLTVLSVQASAEGVTWIVERASDGVRSTLRFAGQVGGALSIAAGQAITVVAMGTGWVLCTAGRALAFVPNEVGSRLLYSQRISR
jgi:hypothetical protein